MHTLLILKHAHFDQICKNAKGVEVGVINVLNDFDFTAVYVKTGSLYKFQNLKTKLEKYKKKTK